MRPAIAFLACLILAVPGILPTFPAAAQEGEGGLMDDLQDIRRNYQKQFNFELDRGQQVQDPLIAGTRIVVGAMTQLDDAARSRQIESAVALLRNNPDVIEGVFQRALRWIDRNPQMAEQAGSVLRTVAAQLDAPESDRKGRFALPGGF